MRSIDEKKEFHVAMFPWFAFGHISPFVQLSNKLSLHGVKFSFLTAKGNIPRIRSSLHSTDVNVIPLTIPPVDGIPAGVESTAEMTFQMAELLKKALDAMQPDIQALLENLRPDVVVFDFAHHWLPSLAAPLNIKTIFFSVFASIRTAYTVVPSRRPDPQSPNPTVDECKRPPPGYPPISFAPLETYEAKDCCYVYAAFDGPSVYDRVSTGIKNSDAMLLKSCLEMEAPFVEYMGTQYGKPVLLTGPIVADPPAGQLETLWADWLGQFEEKSVVFCSFGSETFLSDDQIRQLVLGLEMAAAPFLVVLNFPPGEDATARLKSALPEGFLERVKGKGMVHVGWVQQLHILAHPNVGCFLFHAGLSSIIEATAHDCQLVLVPLKADQFMNSKLVSSVMKAGVEVKRDSESGDFVKENVCKAVETVMKKANEEPGKIIRENHRKWREFFNDKKVQDKFVTDLIQGMKSVVNGDLDEVKKD